MSKFIEASTTNNY